MGLIERLLGTKNVEKTEEEKKATPAYATFFAICDALRSGGVTLLFPLTSVNEDGSEWSIQCCLRDGSIVKVTVEDVWDESST